VTYPQGPPFCVQVELTEGCNLRCAFCGLGGIRGKANNLQFMCVETALRIISLLRLSGWYPRIEFAMHGEPSLNPNLLEILRTFRRRLPPKFHLMMTSNGAGFVANPTQTIDGALRWLNVLALEDYRGIHLVEKITTRYQGPHVPTCYPQSKQANPHRRRKPGEHDWVIIQDIDEATQGTHAALNNHSGCGSPKNNRGDGRRCAKPFRELSIRWDGNVAICCNDWRGYCKIGNVLSSTLEELWQSPVMRAARRKLYHGMRDFGPCHGCDALSYRPGLLPDKHGKQILPQPTKEDCNAIQNALAGHPYTAPVPCPWES